ncbi:helix-turn-helix domain-containing protein [Streptomyces sp. NPDC046374]|uniref:helix-turn-helix domain-containing protein n=1 Tax=Streptomyces sp. NPDC046374 TaxID=3154917 RepID=UPI0033D7AC1E
MYGDTWDKGVDLVAVERAASLRGECPPLQPEDVRRAVQVMTEGGQSAQVIADRLGMCDRTVTRWREEMGLSS